MLKFIRYALAIICFAASVGCLALWWRSHWRLEILENRMGSSAVQLSSVNGRVAIASMRRSVAIGQAYLNVVAGDSADWRRGGYWGFACHRDGMLWAIVVPHWLPAITFAAIAVISWTSHKVSFSLRALIIAMTVVAGLLGTAVAL